MPTNEQRDVIEAAVKLIGESTDEKDIDPADYRILRMAVQALIEVEARRG